MIDQFSVTQFFARNVGHETVRKGVSLEAAVAAFSHYAFNPAARIGITNRVIITDGEDKICMEWKYGKGIVFPPPEKKP